jgi:hypothetical protein
MDQKHGNILQLEQVEKTQHFGRESDLDSVFELPKRQAQEPEFQAASQAKWASLPHD